MQIHAALSERGLEVDRRRIEVGEPIKELGEHTVKLKLHREVVAELRVTVIAEE